MAPMLLRLLSDAKHEQHVAEFLYLHPWYFDSVLLCVACLTFSGPRLELLWFPGV